MTVAELLRSLPPPGDPSGGVAVSSRIRLARNLAGRPFPGRAGPEERDRVWRELRPAIEALPSLRDCAASGNDEIGEVERRMLVERHLASPEFAEHSEGCGLVVRQDHRAAVMVNEEDHLRLQTLGPGLCLDEAWQLMDAIDNELERQIPMAFSPRLGYLTACPTNIGTGLRASVMLHLPGLALMGEMGQVAHAAQKLGLAVRGTWGEGTDAVGHMYQVSNQATLGQTESSVIGNVERIARIMIENELNARERLAASRPAALRDYVGRAAGLLRHAHLMPTKEALALLSALRLGLNMGMVKGEGRVPVDVMLVLAQPAHIQAMAGRALSAAERDEARATMLRGWMTPPRRRKKKPLE